MSVAGIYGSSFLALRIWEGKRTGEWSRVCRACFGPQARWHFVLWTVTTELLLLTRGCTTQRLNEKQNTQSAQIYSIHRLMGRGQTGTSEIV